MAIKTIDDSILQNIAVAIQSKDNGGKMLTSEMPGRIQAIPTGSPVVANPALVLWDWEGTKLAEFSREDALALTELPAPSALPMYAAADHALLVFQSWNWSLANIKAWIQAHEGETLHVGAIYTTADGQDHNFWGNPRLDSLTAINMQKRGQTSVGSSAFQRCYSLAEISLPVGAVSIGNNAFNACYSLMQINLSGGVTSLGTNAFNACYSLVQISLPDGVTSIGASAFTNCLSLTQISLPDSITTIGASAFANCYSLTQISIPGGVTHIDNNTFQRCYSLVQISLPDGITTIGASAFTNCYSLTQIRIPDSVTSIGASAFNACYSLCDILNESQAALADVNAFADLPTNYRVYVPRANLSWYETATNWATIYTQGHIVAIEDYIDYLESIGFNVNAYKEAA